MKLAARLPVALVLASALAFVLAARGFDAFEGVRAKVVTGTLPATNGAVHLTADGRGTVARLKPPFAVIVTLGNDADTPQTFAVALDGRTICQPELKSHEQKHRADCVMDGAWPAGITHEVAITGTQPQWSLQGLELATHHGASSGAHQIFVIPRDATPFSKPSTLEVAIFWIATLVLFLLPTATLPRVVRWLYLAACAAIGLLLVAMILAPWVSRFSIVVGWATLARWVVVLALPAVWRLAAQLIVKLRDKRSEWSRLGRPAAVALIVLAVFALVTRERVRSTYLGNYSGFVQIGQVFVENSPYIAHNPDVRRTLVVEQGGYDGQFFYYLAWDPLLRAFRADPKAFDGLYDTPPYRFGRIGYVWLTWLASFGDWHRFPKTMVWLDLAGIFAAAFALSIAARDVGANVLWGLVALFIPAFWQSLETTLPEPIAAGFLLLAYLAWSRGRWLGAALLLAASLLVRETGLALVAVLAVTMALRRQLPQAIALTGVAVAPFAFWHLYVGWLLWPDWGLQGFFFRPELIGLPFVGFFNMWAHVRVGDYEMDLARATYVLPILLTLAWLVALAAVVVRRSALTVATALYATVAISLNFVMVWVHTRNGERVTYEVFILTALCSSMLSARSRMWTVALASFWVLAGYYVFWVGFDGDFYRQTLMDMFL
jgi:hypothetical protein